MLLIHESVERVIECDPSGACVEYEEGYEVYEHLQQDEIHVRVYGAFPMTVILTHEELPVFCRLFDLYKNPTLREKRKLEHVYEAMRSASAVEYYHTHQMELTALRIPISSFIEMCKRDPAAA